MKAQRKDAWQPDEDAYLRKLNRQNLTRSDMVNKVVEKFPSRSTVTRNAIIGRVHRLSIIDGHEPRGRVQQNPRKIHKLVMPRPPTMNRPPIPRTGMIRLPALPPLYQRAGTCQYVEGDIKPFVMCGKASRGPWCEEHGPDMVRKPV